MKEERIYFRNRANEIVKGTAIATFVNGVTGFFIVRLDDGKYDTVHVEYCQHIPPPEPKRRHLP